MNVVTQEFLHRLPKTDLHCHLDGSLRIETFIDFARTQNVALPTENPSDLKRAMDFGCIHEDLIAFLRSFNLVCAVMQTKEAIERVAYELVEDAARENVVVIEPRFYPKFLMKEGLRIEEVIEAALRGAKSAEKQFGVSANLILCALKHMPDEDSWDVVKAAARYRGQGVVAFDLAGPEAGYPTKNYAKLCHFARDQGLAVTVHAGEAFGPESIAQAINDCGAQRIGHGTTLIQDEDLMNELRDRKIPIEICLSSNVQTKAVESFETHPAMRYLQAGVKVTFCTDNRLMSDTDVTNELWLAHQHLGLTAEQIQNVVQTGFESAFLTEA